MSSGQIVKTKTRIHALSVLAVRDDSVLVAQYRLQLGVVAERVIWLEAELIVLDTVQSEADIYVLPGLAVRTVSVGVVAACLSLVAELLAVVLGCARGRDGMGAASDRLELGVVTQGVVRLEAVSVRFAVVQAEADRGVLPALAVRAMGMGIFATLFSLLTKVLAVAGVVVVCSHETQKTQEASFLVHEI